MSNTGLLTIAAVCSLANILPARTPPKHAKLTLDFTVRLHSSITMNEEQVRKILVGASKELSKACKEVRGSRSAKKLRKSWCEEIEFHLTVPVLPMNAIDKDLLRRNGYDEAAIEAIQRSEATGLYGRDGVQAVLATAKPGDGFQINIVQNIVSYCPGESDKIGVQELRKKQEGAYLWPGCSHIYGHASVMRPIANGEKKESQRIKGESVLWAHEIAHLLGLEDVAGDLLPPLRVDEAGWLMVHPYKPESTRLSVLECDVLMHYPNNKVQRTNMEDFVQHLKTLKEKSDAKKSGAPRRRL